MPLAIPLSIRQQAVTLFLEQQSVAAISQQLSISQQSLRRLLTRFKDQPTQPLLPAYQRCGPKKGCTQPDKLRAAGWLKRRHPQWGVPLIHYHLAQRYGGQQIPAIRTLQKHFRQLGLTLPRQPKPQGGIGRATAPHNIWQVDAKERLVLIKGQPACYLTMVDEHSGAGLEALVFPPQPNQSSAH